VADNWTASAPTADVISNTLTLIRAIPPPSPAQNPLAGWLNALAFLAGWLPASLQFAA
jgi:hypothetical protein